jgi:hypothetical protein
MAQRANLIDTIDPKLAVASTVFNIGYWVMSNGSGAFTPLTPTNKIVGLCLENIASTDANYASTKLISVDTVDSTIDRFIMPVATGTASAANVGLFYDVAASPNFGSLNVSATGTQFEVTRFINASTVEVRAALF